VTLRQPLQPRPGTQLEQVRMRHSTTSPARASPPCCGPSGSTF
jgi:hypothetical protein